MCVLNDKRCVTNDKCFVTNIVSQVTNVLTQVTNVLTQITNYFSPKMTNILTQMLEVHLDDMTVSDSSTQLVVLQSGLLCSWHIYWNNMQQILSSTVCSD